MHSVLPCPAAPAAAITAQLPPALMCGGGGGVSALSILSWLTQWLR